MIERSSSTRRAGSSGSGRVAGSGDSSVMEDDHRSRTCPGSVMNTPRSGGRAPVHDLLTSRAVSILARVPLHPVLLAAFAVLSVYAGNLSEVLPVDLGGPTGPLVRAVVAAAIVLGVCALLFRDWRRGAIVATALVAAFALFGRVAAALGDIGLDETIQLIAWGALVVAAVLFAIRARGSLRTATVTLNAFTLVMVGLTLLTIVPYES